MVIIGYHWFYYKTKIKENKIKKYKKKTKQLKKSMTKKRDIFDKSARFILQKNPALIEIFSGLFVFARFDKQNFKNALIQANQLERIYKSSQIGVVLPDQIIDIAEGLMRDILNSIHSMIHSLPSTTIGDYRWQVQLNILQKVLQKIIDDIKEIAKIQYEKIGPTIHSPPPDVRCGPWANPLSQKEYNPYWEQYY
jgi:hypothetical protein